MIEVCQQQLLHRVYREPDTSHDLPDRERMLAFVCTANATSVLP